MTVEILVSNKPETSRVGLRIGPKPVLIRVYNFSPHTPLGNSTEIIIVNVDCRLSNYVLMSSIMGDDVDLGEGGNSLKTRRQGVICGDD